MQRKSSEFRVQSSEFSWQLTVNSYQYSVASLQRFFSSVMLNSFQHLILFSRSLSKSFFLSLAYFSFKQNHETLKQVQRDNSESLRSVMLNLFSSLNNYFNKLVFMNLRFQHRIRIPQSNIQSFYFLFFTFYFLLSTPFAHAQIQTQLNPEKILIGDTASLQITVTFDKHQHVQLPQVKDSLNRYIEISEQKIDTLQVGNNMNYVQNLTLTGFEPGEFLVNALPVIIDGDTLQSQSQKLKILDLEVDENSDKIFPIKPIMEQKITWWDKYKKYVWYFVGGLLLALLIIAIIWLYIKELKKKKYISTPLLPPYEEALDNLRKLDKANYLKQQKYYEYYSDLSFILRRYFGRRFDFPAQAYLSGDLPDTMLKKEYIHQDEAVQLTEFLKDADLAKYARSVPPEEKHTFYRKWTEELIHHTRPILEDDLPEHIRGEESEKIRKIDNS